MSEIVEQIGLPALLEQLAEECSELSQACLKYSRKLRGENPTPKTEQDCVVSLREEVSDVRLCIAQLDLAGLYDYTFVLNTMGDKLLRWHERLREAERDEEWKE